VPRKTASRKAPTTGGRGSRRRPTAKAAAAPRVITLRGTTLPTPNAWGAFSPAHIGPETAIRVSSIFGVVRWIAQAVAICPMQIMRELPGGRREKADIPCAYTLRKRPNRWQSAWDFYLLEAYWAALHGNGYARVLPGPRGWCDQLIPMHPSRVKVEQASDYSLVYQFWNNDGRWEYLDQEEVLHWRWISDNGVIGQAPAEMNATSIQLARKLDTAATAFWDNSARPDMVLETDEKIPDEAIDALRRALHEVYGGAANRGKAAVLPKKTRLKPIESNSMEASQFQELRDAILPDVCRHWGVPSTLLGDSKMAKYSTVEQEHLSAQVWCLLPWARRMESPIDMAIQPVYGEDVYAKLDTRGILRADTSGRAALYQALWNMGAITPNEIRDREDFELLDTEAANQTFVQLGFSTLDAAAAQAWAAGGEPPAAVAEPAAEPAAEPETQPAAPGAGVPEAGGFREGQRVYWADGQGVIEHLMIDGVLGVEGSPFAIAATEAEPAASVRVYEDGEPTEFTVGKRVADLSATPIDDEGDAIDDAPPA
jgi:HK97 family phage portal protein